MKKSIFAFAALALCATLSAQNINQSVQVTNDYVTRFADFQKQGGALQVPDSLYRFDYKFDYSVFDTPYKGAYEFSPYAIRVTPEARPYDGRTLYVRAGAGFTFHPQFELAWQALRREDLTLGVYAGAGGYAGKYRSAPGLDPFPGHDLNAHAGIAGQYLLPAARLSYQLGYEGISAGENGAQPAFRSGFNSVLLRAGAASRERPGDHFFYDADFRFRHSGERYDSVLNVDPAKEENLHLGVSGGPVLDGKYRILLDAAFDMDVLRLGRQTCNVNLVDLRPHVDFLLGPVRLDAGVRLDFGQPSAAGQFSLAPDVSARLDLLDVDLSFFAGVSGGQSMQRLYDAKRLNHFAFASEASASIVRERLRVRAGLDGRWNSRLQYGLEAGYVSYAGRALASWYGVCPVDYSSVYARAKLSWADERLAVDGNLGYEFLTLPDDVAAFAPPAYTMDVRGTYNWQRRIFAGAFLEAASVRRALSPGLDDLGGYANLGLTGEYRIDRRWGAWAEAGNLLGMAIQRFPGYIEKGPYLTVGLTLSL